MGCGGSGITCRGLGEWDCENRCSSGCSWDAGREGCNGTVNCAEIVDEGDCEFCNCSWGINIQINIGDAWKDCSDIWINIGDSWKVVRGIWINVGDSWKLIFGS